MDKKNERATRRELRKIRFPSKRNIKKLRNLLKKITSTRRCINDLSVDLDNVEFIIGSYLYKTTSSLLLKMMITFKDIFKKVEYTLGILTGKAIHWSDII